MEIKKNILILMLASIPISAFSDSTVVVKNLFRKHWSQIMTPNTNKVKVCRADNAEICTEEVVLKYDQDHAFKISNSDSKFALL